MHRGLTVDLFATRKVAANQIQSEKSKLELLAEQRDYRRRRTKYRAKNVHITKRTPLQVSLSLPQTFSFKGVKFHVFFFRFRGII